MEFNISEAHQLSVSIRMPQLIWNAFSLDVQKLIDTKQQINLQTPKHGQTNMC